MYKTTNSRMDLHLPWMMILFGALLMILGFTTLAEPRELSETKSRDTLIHCILQPKSSGQTNH